MAQDGQRTPIEVTKLSKSDDTYSITCGWVRFQAARDLGWDEIDAVVWRGSAVERAQRQIDDNLIQEGCTALDRALYLAAGKAAYEAAHPETRNGAAAWRDQSLNSETLISFWKVASARYGLSRPAIFKALAVGQSIASPAVALLAAGRS